MYRCGISAKNSLPGQKAERVVTKRRPKQYWGERENKETKKMEEVMIAEGWEIVEELIVLPEVAEQYRNGQIEVPQTNKASSRSSEGFTSRIKTIKKI